MDTLATRVDTLTSEFAQIKALLLNLQPEGTSPAGPPPTTLEWEEDLLSTRASCSHFEEVGAEQEEVGPASQTSYSNSEQGTVQGSRASSDAGPLRAQSVVHIALARLGLDEAPVAAVAPSAALRYRPHSPTWRSFRGAGQMLMRGLGASLTISETARPLLPCRTQTAVGWDACPLWSQPRLKRAKPVFKGFILPHSAHSIGPSGDYARRLVHVARLEGRILTHSDGATAQAVPAVCIRRPCLSIQGAPVRAFLSPSGLHKMHAGSSVPDPGQSG